jgi:hypothetical protein
MPATVAGFLFKLDWADGHVAIDALAHVADGEGGHGDRAEQRGNYKDRKILSVPELQDMVFACFSRCDRRV